MYVIPVINCPDQACAAKKIAVLKTFLAEDHMIHMDVTDGVFADHQTWSDPMGWASLASPFPLEVHLMVEHPEEVADAWFAAGARRVIVHLETLTPISLHEIRSSAERYHGEVMISSRPETTIEELTPYLRVFTLFQVLAVNPGAAGQTFLPFAEEKIRFLREEVPDATIEVDGGMNLATAKLVQSFGADTIVSASYIFESADPKKAYEDLRAI